MKDGEDKPGVRVRDRRVSAGGDAKDAASATDERARPAGGSERAQEPAAAAGAGAQPANGRAAEGRPVTEGERPAEGGLPEPDFVTFVLSLSTSAMLSLGALPRPETGKPAPDLALARQTIDILAMLQEKTRGNLTGEEERILDSVLYDLRMSYVHVATGSKGPQ